MLLILRDKCKVGDLLIVIHKVNIEPFFHILRKLFKVSHVCFRKYDSLSPCLKIVHVRCGLEGIDWEPWSKTHLLVNLLDLFLEIPNSCFSAVILYQWKKICSNDNMNLTTTSTPDMKQNKSKITTLPEGRYSNSSETATSVSGWDGLTSPEIAQEIERE